MLEKARQSMDAGATGLIIGRNVFQRGTPNRSGSSPNKGDPRQVPILSPRRNRGGPRRSAAVRPAESMNVTL